MMGAYYSVEYFETYDDDQRRLKDVLNKQIKCSRLILNTVQKSDPIDIPQTKPRRFNKRRMRKKRLHKINTNS